MSMTERREPADARTAPPAATTHPATPTNTWSTTPTAWQTFLHMGDEGVARPQEPSSSVLRHRHDRAGRRPRLLGTGCEGPGLGSWRGSVRGAW